MNCGIILLVAVAAVSSSAAARDLHKPIVTRPEELLGLTLEEAVAIYPSNCQLRPQHDWEEPDVVAACDIKKHDKYLFQDVAAGGKLKIVSQTIEFKKSGETQVVQRVRYLVDGGDSLLKLLEVYGIDFEVAPPPTGASYSFGTLTVGDTTLDNTGESHRSLKIWKKAHFTVYGYDSFFASWGAMAKTGDGYTSGRHTIDVFLDCRRPVATVLQPLIHSDFNRIPPPPGVRDLCAPQ